MDDSTQRPGVYHTFKETLCSDGLINGKLTRSRSWPQSQTALGPTEDGVCVRESDGGGFNPVP